MSALIKLLLAFDCKWPGAADAPMVLPAKDWARLVELARKEKTRKAKRKAGAR